MALPNLSKYEKFADLTNGRMRYYELGSGTNHTILAHGMGVVTSADTFQFVVEDLAKRGLHIYDIDYLGFGKSTRAMQYGPTFDVIIDGIREFMDVKGIRQANLVGHSAGGWFGPILAYESPDRIRKLVMVGAAGMNVTPVGNVSGYAAPAKEGLLRGAKNSVFPGSHLTAEMAEEMAAQQYSYGMMPGAVDGLRPLVHQMAVPEIRRQYLLQRRLPYIKVPTLVIWGKGDTMDPYPTWTQEYQKLKGDMSKSSKPWVIPGAKYHLNEGGHNFQWEKPQDFVRVVGDFLTS